MISNRRPGVCRPGAARLGAARPGAARPGAARLGAAVLALVVTIAACGGDDAAAPAATDAGGTEASGAGDAEGASNKDDVEFAQGMIAHHEQAIEMSEVALDPTVGAGTEVIDLATRIKAAQDPEVEQMTAWLTAAGESITMDMSDGHDMSSMPGMMSVEQMDSMAAMTGADFDVMWLEMMIAHHEGAITQSEAVIANGADPELRSLAEQIIAVQQAEIAEMETLLDR
jgi:uncharacterized protein (DUF305 family)